MYRLESSYRYDHRSSWVACGVFGLARGPGLSPVNYGCGTERQGSGSTAGAKSWLTAQRSEVKQAGTRRSQASWAAHSLLV